LTLKAVLVSQAWYICDCHTQVWFTRQWLHSATGGAGSIIFSRFYPCWVRTQAVKPCRPFLPFNVALELIFTPLSICSDIIALSVMD